MEILFNIRALQDFLGEKWLANLLGIVGGTLGIYAFVDNYILKFKPRIYIASQVIFKLKDNRHARKELDKIILSLEISNNRKKYGLIHDLAIKIYTSDEINPDTVIYYSSETSSKIVSNEENVSFEDLKNYSPISVLPNSSKSITVLFGEVVNRSKTSINDRKDFYYELYYQINGKGKWKYATRAYLYNLKDSHFMDGKDYGEDFVLFTSLDFNSTREKLNKIKEKTITTIYRGAFHQAKDSFLRHWRYRMTKPFSYCKDFFQLIGINIKLFANREIDRKLKVPIILKYAKAKRGGRLTFGNKKFAEITVNAIEELGEVLVQMAEVINKNALPELKIKVEKKADSEIQISCYHMFLKIYKSGDGHIQVQEADSLHGSKVRFSLQLKENLFNYQYWYLRNNGYTTIRSLALKIIDFLMLHHGNYR